jgi:hypothetical protein
MPVRTPWLIIASNSSIPNPPFPFPFPFPPATAAGAAPARLGCWRNRGGAGPCGPGIGMPWPGLLAGPCPSARGSNPPLARWNSGCRFWWRICVRWVWPNVMCSWCVLSFTTTGIDHENSGLFLLEVPWPAYFQEFGGSLLGQPNYRRAVSRASRIIALLCPSAQFTFYLCWPSAGLLTVRCRERWPGEVQKPLRRVIDGGYYLTDHVLDTLALRAGSVSLMNYTVRRSDKVHEKSTVSLRCCDLCGNTLLVAGNSLLVALATHSWLLVTLGARK